MMSPTTTNPRITRDTSPTLLRNKLNPINMTIATTKTLTNATFLNLYYSIYKAKKPIQFLILQ